MPWASKTKIDFGKKHATVTVVSEDYDEKALVRSLKNAGFGGSVVASTAQPAAAIPKGPRAAFHVAGMSATKAGIILGEGPARIAKALEKTRAARYIAWDFESSVVTITYDDKRTDPQRLAAVIEGLKLDVKPVSLAKRETEKRTANSPGALPKNAPTALAAALKDARAAKRPVVMVFWSPSCAACVQLKDRTLTDRKVARELEGVEVLHVDVEEHPDFAKSLGVRSVPDVFFIDAKGAVVDRLQKAEKPKAFLKRLESLTAR